MASLRKWRLWQLRSGRDASIQYLTDTADLLLDATLAASEAQRTMLWRMREELGAAMRSEGKVVRNDISVPVGTVPELIARGREVFHIMGEGRLDPALLTPGGIVMTDASITYPAKDEGAP